METNTYRGHKNQSIRKESKILGTIHWKIVAVHTLLEGLIYHLGNI